VYCSTCTSPVVDLPGRYVDKLCPAPAACTISTTTSSTAAPSSTSTSLPSSTCGNGIVESPEQCDGANLGICPTLTGADEFPFACEDPGYQGECRCCLTDTC